MIINNGIEHMGVASSFVFFVFTGYRSQFSRLLHQTLDLAPVCEWKEAFFGFFEKVRDLVKCFSI